MAYLYNLNTRGRIEKNITKKNRQIERYGRKVNGEKYEENLLVKKTSLPPFQNVLHNNLMR